MIPSRAIWHVKKLVEAGKAVMLTGAPGVGKTDIAFKIKEMLKCDMVLTHAVVKEPTDAKGMPFPNLKKGVAEFLPFGDLKKILEATELTIWFLDDLGQAPPSVQAAFMQLILAREIDGVRIPDCVTFIAATNRKQDRAGVSGILEPVKSRFITIIPIEVSLHDWCVWALEKKYNPKLVAFMRWKCTKEDTTMLHDHKPTADMTNGQSPRTWAHVGDLDKIDFKTDYPLSDESFEQDMLELYSGAVGQPAALEYRQFLKIMDRCPNPNSILATPLTAEIPTEMSILTTLVVCVSALANASLFQSVLTYAKRLEETHQGEMASLLIRESVRLSPDIAKTPEYGMFIATEYGQQLLN